MKGAIQNLILVIAALALAYYSAIPAQVFYCANIGTCTGGFFGFDLGILIWMMVIYSFCSTALLTIFGGRNKYWWVAAAITPAFLFQITIDLYHTYLLIIWIPIAWGLGIFVHKTLTKFAPSLIANIK